MLARSCKCSSIQFNKDLALGTRMLSEASAASYDDLPGFTAMAECSRAFDS